MWPHGGLPHGGPDGGELETSGQMTALFPGNAGGSRGAPGDNGPSSVNCGGGNILGSP